MKGNKPPDFPSAQEWYHNLFTEHYRRIYGIVYHILGRREAAEDITQEAFVKAFQNIHQLKNPDKFGAWLAVIASNLARNHWKREKRIILSEEIENSAGTGEDDPEQRALQNLEVERVRKALRTLPPRLHEVIVLQYYYDLKIKEIAQLLKIGTGTVKSRLFRARRRLSGCLEPKSGLNGLSYREDEPNDAPKF